MFEIPVWDPVNQAFTNMPIINAEFFLGCICGLFVGLIFWVVAKDGFQ